MFFPRQSQSFQITENAYHLFWPCVGHFSVSLFSHTIFIVVKCIVYLRTLCREHTIESVQVTSPWGSWGSLFIFSLFSFIILDITKSCFENVTRQINLCGVLWFNRWHFNWVENINQFNKEVWSNWKEMPIKRLDRGLFSPVLLMKPILAS